MISKLLLCSLPPTPLSQRPPLLINSTDSRVNSSRYGHDLSRESYTTCVSHILLLCACGNRLNTNRDLVYVLCSAEPALVSPEELKSDTKDGVFWYALLFLSSLFSLLFFLFFCPCLHVCLFVSVGHSFIHSGMKSAHELTATMGSMFKY